MHAHMTNRDSAAITTTLALAPVIRFGFTLFLALTIHAIVVLGVGFTKSDKSELRHVLPGLEVIIANSRSLDEVENPDYLAQVDQAGGGKADEKARPSAPISANTPINQHGLAEQAQARVKEKPTRH